MANTDIFARYTKHLSPPNPLPPLLAAISSITDLIAVSPTSTVSEVLTLITTLRRTLIATAPTPLLLDAGTASFERWLITALGRADIDRDAGGENDTIVQMGRSYVTDALAEGAETAKTACAVCGNVGGVGAGGAVVVLVPVWDGVVAGVLAQAVKSGRRPTVVLREAGGRPGCVDTASGAVDSATFYADMRASYGLFEEAQKRGEYEILGAHDFAEFLATRSTRQARIVLTTAALNCANGGVMASAGMLEVAVAAKSAGVPYYVVGEAWRNAGIFPLVVRRELDAEDGNKEDLLVKARKEGLAFIPADHIEAIFLGKQVLNPTRLADEIIKSLS